MKKVNVTYDGELVATAEVNEDAGVMEFEIEKTDLKYILSGYDPNEELSVGVVRDRIVEQYSDADISVVEAYYRNRPKGTFDA